jgi:acyl-CoA thioester hydrolase
VKLSGKYRSDEPIVISSETKIRVRYADTDQMKMAYYAKYFEYFEQGRADLLRSIGMPYGELERMGYYLPVVEAHAEYRRPARYDDLLSVKAIVREMPQARIRIEYVVTNDLTHEELGGGHTMHSFVNAGTGKATRAPEKFLELFRKSFSI